MLTVCWKIGTSPERMPPWWCFSKC